MAKNPKTSLKIGIECLSLFKTLVKWYLGFILECDILGSLFDIFGHFLVCLNKVYLKNLQ